MTQVTNETKATKNIAQMAAENGALSTLAAGLKAAGLTETLAGAGPFTVFAPSDEAFKKLPHGALEALLKDQAKLKTVLTYHVVKGRLSAKDLKAGDLNTVEGSAVHVKLSGASVEVNGAHVTGADVFATNGVIHMVDAVLMPKNVQLLAAA